MNKSLESYAKYFNKMHTNKDTVPDKNKDFEGWIIYQMENGENISKQDLKTLVFECNEIQRDYGDNRRWLRSVNSYIQVKDRIICVPWEEGLTEMQENEFFDKPYFVKKHTYEKTVTVTEFVPEDTKEADNYEADDIDYDEV